MVETQNSKRDRAEIKFDIIALTIIGIILLMVIAVSSYASTEAGPADAALMTAEQANTLLGGYGVSKTGEVEAATSTCSVTFYKTKLFGLIPRQITHTLTYKGVDFSKFTVENIYKAFLKNIEADCGGCEKEILEKWQGDIVAVRVRCPLQDGEFDFALRKN